jgi:hypothetical protein
MEPETDPTLAGIVVTISRGWKLLFVAVGPVVILQSRLEWNDACPSFPYREAQNVMALIVEMHSVVWAKYEM